MAKDREERYSTCREFSDAVHAIEWDGPGSVTRPAGLADSAATTRTSRPAVTRPDAEPGAEPTTPTTVAGRWRRTRWLLAALLAVVLVAAAVAYVVWPGEESADRQVVLPLTGLQGPAGLAVSGSGNLYIADSAAKQVLEVRAGSYEQTVLPFTGLDVPQGVAVSTSGDVYVSDLVTNTVTMLHGSTQVPMPIGGLNQPFGIALGPDGTLYVADTLNNRVMALRDVTAAPVAVPLTVIGPFAVAVGEQGDLYVGTPNKVLAWNAATRAQSFLPFTDLQSVGGVAVDDEGTVYAIDQNHNRILRLPAGSDEQEVLPFTGLDQPEGIAVSSRGDVYVADTDNSRVVMLPAGS
ncbi:NHL repeat-containing protein [Streptomyces sp. NPDC058171]